MKTSESMRAMVSNEEPIPSELILVWAEKFDELEDRCVRLQKLAHDYIEAYEKLAFAEEKREGEK